ncbi:MULTISPECIES: hypothetical protein [unclassified Microcoleus]|uniref:hypothetical protein n=1 Tax=unclassified Microcoleus TaxID=2642155 RepID=UPI002FD735DF
MEQPNVYTYRHSEMPPMTDEIKSEIEGIDLNAGNAILRFEGNYRALSALAETLAGLLEECETKLQCIRIIPDGDGDEAASRAIGFTDLPTVEKHVVISTAITSTVAIKILAEILDCEFEDAAFQVRTIAQAEFGSMSPEQIEQAVTRLSETLRNKPDTDGFFIDI